MQKLWDLRHNSLVRYFLVGLGAFASQYIVLNFGYYALSISLHIATSIGYLCGLGLSFFFNRHWVFGEGGKHKHVGHQAIEYIILVIFNYTFTVLGVSFLKREGVEPYISPVITTALITVWNYMIFNKIIFKGKKIEPNAY